MAKNFEEDQIASADSDHSAKESEATNEISFHEVMRSDSVSSSSSKLDVENDPVKGRSENAGALPRFELVAFMGAAVEGVEKAKDIQPKNDKSEKDKLFALTDAKIEDPKARELFKADLQEIEKHVRDGRISAAEASATFAEVGRLFNTESKVGVSAENRTILARQVLHNAAHPSSADQGAYDNCNVASPEVRLYHRNPASMAKLVADVALNGKYTASNGQTVDVSRSVQPADKAHLQVPAGENKRSYASQIYHLVSINLALKDKFPGKNLEYAQQAATPEDNGSRVLDLSQKPPKEVYEINPDGSAVYESARVKDDKGRPALDANLQPVMTSPMSNPGLTIQDSFNTMEKITGKKEVGSCIAHYEQGGYATNWIWDKIGLSGHARRDERIPYFSNEAELKNLLSQAQDAKLFPILLQVNSGSGFLGKQVAEAAGKPLGGEGAGFGGGHVLCLKDYDPASGKVGVDNTWGDSRDKLGADRVSLKEVITISQTDTRLAAKAQEFNNNLQAAYKYWCRENKKTAGEHYPSPAVGKIWLQRYQRELQKALEDSSRYNDYPAFFY